ncbi:unnamed protein product [Closterium sp. NIES-65]|nr:unnamed protein product [Closterium sp. NIES-65]
MAFLPSGYPALGLDPSATHAISTSWWNLDRSLNALIEGINGRISSRAYSTTEGDGNSKNDDTIGGFAWNAHGRRRRVVKFWRNGERRKDLAELCRRGMGQVTLDYVSGCLKETAVPRFQRAIKEAASIGEGGGRGGNGAGRGTKKGGKQHRQKEAARKLLLALNELCAVKHAFTLVLADVAADVARCHAKYGVEDTWGHPWAQVGGAEEEEEEEEEEGEVGQEEGKEVGEAEGEEEENEKEESGEDRGAGEEEEWGGEEGGAVEELRESMQAMLVNATPPQLYDISTRYASTFFPARTHAHACMAGLLQEFLSSRFKDVSECMRPFYSEDDDEEEEDGEEEDEEDDEEEVEEGEGEEEEAEDLEESAEKLHSTPVVTSATPVVATATAGGERYHQHPGERLTPLLDAENQNLHGSFPGFGEEEAGSEGKGRGPRRRLEDEMAALEARGRGVVERGAGEGEGDRGEVREAAGAVSGAEQETLAAVLDGLLGTAGEGEEGWGGEDAAYGDGGGSGEGENADSPVCWAGRLEGRMGRAWVWRVQQVMRALGFSGLSFLSHAVLSAVLLARLKAHVHASAGAVFDRRILLRLHRWLQVTALPFVTITTCTVTTKASTTGISTSRGDASAISSCSSRVSDPISAAHLRQWHAWLRHVAGRELCAVRTGQLFDIIVDYPDSTPALLDLKDCLENGGAAAAADATAANAGSTADFGGAAVVEGFGTAAFAAAAPPLIALVAAQGGSSLRGAMGGEGAGLGREGGSGGGGIGGVGNAYGRLVASFRAALANRLLTAGASTADILQQYVSAIRALRLVDPSGVVLEAVSEPIRQYLRGRKDTIRCIMTLLTQHPSAAPGGAIKAAADVADDVAGEAGDPGDLSLLEELSRAAEGGEGEMGGSGEGEEEGAGLGEDLSAAYAAAERWQPDPIDADPWQSWQPVPIDADPWQSTGQAQRARDIVRVLAGVWQPDPIDADPWQSSGQAQRARDIVRVLAGVFGSREVLLGEYRGMLAERLVGRAGYDTDRDVRTLELLKVRGQVLLGGYQGMLAERLVGRAGYDTDRDVRTLELRKLRFGESNLHACEVMLRDMADSKRINGNVKAAMRKAREEARDLAEARSNIARSKAIMRRRGLSVVGTGRGAATAQRESRGTGGGVSGAGVSGSGVSGSGSSAWSQAHTPEHLVVRGMASFSTPPDRPGRGGEGGEGGGGGGIVGGGGASQWFTPDSFASPPPPAAAAQAPPGAPAPPPRAARPNLLSRWARLRPDLRTPTFSGDRSADRGQPGNSARTPGQSGGGSSAMGGNRSAGRGGQGGLWDVMDALGGEGSGDEEDEGEIEGGEEEEEAKPEEKEELLEAENLDATIVSALFWPAFQEESVRLPAPVTKLMEEYSTNYATLKAPRKLQWKANLGCVTIELEFGNGRSTQQYTVTPVQAAIILKFQTAGAGGGDKCGGSADDGAENGEVNKEDETRPQWAASELAAAVGLSVPVLRRRITFWVNQGVIVESVATNRSPPEPLFTAVDYQVDPASAGAAGDAGGDRDGDADAAAAAAAGEGAGLGGLRGDGEGEDMVAGGELLIGDEDEEEEGGGMVASLEAQRKQESAVHESFITGMLTTFDGLPIERIHNMLKMFVSDPPYDRSLAQLHAFLGVLVAQEKLELRDGLYRKKK